LRRSDARRQGETVFTELIGWSAAAILLATIGRQVFTQWRDRTTAGVSHWLFIGQLCASVGFVIYSWLLGDWVFVATNAAMLVTALVGQYIYLRNSHGAGGVTGSGAGAQAKKPYSARG
jgi:uncharacterized protein with PQ loop repeat